MNWHFYKHQNRPIEERFWEKVHIKDNDDCWVWLADVNNWGYGVFRVGTKTQSAHRVAWELKNGKIMNDMCVLHRCDNPACCNPEHLFLGTNMDNTRDKIQKGRGNNGERHGNAKLKNDDIVEIRKLRDDGQTLVSIAKKYGVSGEHIWSICTRKAWRHIP